MHSLLLLLFVPLVALLSAAWVIILLVLYLGVLHPIWSGSATIEEGSAYGLTIGASKDQVYSDLIKSFPIRDLSMYEPDFPHAPSDLKIIDEGVYEILMNENYWQIRPFNRRPEHYGLTFRNGALIKIHHYWLAGELP
jgi:hypothetical protein